MARTQLQEQAAASIAAFGSTVTFQPKPKALDPFLVMRFDLNILRNPSFNGICVAVAVAVAVSVSLSVSLSVSVSVYMYTNVRWCVYLYVP